ncbi:MAG TPA: asparaginase [Anaerolineae bacterium]|nr:asparaginase [Anaerolineae bacterium]
MNPNTAYVPIYQLLRGGIVESSHSGAMAMADSSGELHAWIGDPHALTFMRSSAKPFQALPVIESGTAARFTFSLKQIALACASHVGTDDHVETLEALQKFAGIDERDLQCGTHAVPDADTARRLIIEGKEPTPNRHNCSGKHSAMLAMARHLGESIEDYLDPNHEVQRSILTTLAEMCDLEEPQIQLGVDGCSAPNFALPLASAATGLARLADPSDLPPARAAACHTIFEAMTTHPEMVSGEGRFDTRLMQVAGGTILSKAGAEGYQAMALKAGLLGPGSPAMGLAMKIADGNKRAIPPVALAVLQELGALDAEMMAELADFTARPMINYSGIQVGEGCTCFQLERAGK